MMSEPARRLTDHPPFTADIDSMIAAEDDPKQRAFLIVLNNINKSLVANTGTIRDVSDKLETHLAHFEQHTKEDEALRNKGLGAWKVLSVVIGLIQLAGLAIWNNAREELKEIHVTLQKEQVQLMQLESRVLFVEKINK